MSAEQILALVVLTTAAIAVAAPVTWIAMRAGARTGAVDTPPIDGQTKFSSRRVPNTGGIGIFCGVFVPVVVMLGVVWWAPGLIQSVWGGLSEHVPGVRSKTPEALIVLASALSLHALGLIDDRRPLGAWLKLVVMLGVSLACVILTGARLLTAVDDVAGGVWLSVLLTTLWFGVVINAMNFMDNMDGLAGGCAASAACCFAIAAASHGQLFVAGVLCLLLGSMLGFLLLNRPPAKVYMGDGGSLVVGFLLAYLTVRTTYYESDVDGAAWHALLTPLVVLAVPLYDFVSVSVIRISQGKSPLKGDTQHFSHRLKGRGLSDARVALVVAGLTLVTGLGGILLAGAEPWEASLIGAQTLVLLGGIALFEHGSSGGNGS